MATKTTASEAYFVGGSGLMDGGKQEVGHTRCGRQKARRPESSRGKERREEAAISHLARHSGLIG